MYFNFDYGSSNFNIDVVLEFCCTAAGTLYAWVAGMIINDSYPIEVILYFSGKYFQFRGDEDSKDTLKQGIRNFGTWRPFKYHAIASRSLT